MSLFLALIPCAAATHRWSAYQGTSALVEVEVGRAPQGRRLLPRPPGAAAKAPSLKGMSIGSRPRDRTAQGGRYSAVEVGAPIRRGSPMHLDAGLDSIKALDDGRLAEFAGVEGDWRGG